MSVTWLHDGMSGVRPAGIFPVATGYTAPRGEGAFLPSASGPRREIGTPAAAAAPAQSGAAWGRNHVGPRMSFSRAPAPKLSSPQWSVGVVKLDAGSAVIKKIRAEAVAERKMSEAAKAALAFKRRSSRELASRGGGPGGQPRVSRSSSNGSAYRLQARALSSHPSTCALPRRY